MKLNVGFVSGNTGYMIRIHADESISLRETFVGALMVTSTSYIENNTWYRMKITRTSDGEFTVYIRGGSFGDDDWTTVVAGGSGSNPATDTTTTTSEFIVLDVDAGDRISRLLLTDGVEQ